MIGVSSIISMVKYDFPSPNNVATLLASQAPFARITIGSITHLKFNVKNVDFSATLCDVYIIDSLEFIMIKVVVHVKVKMAVGVVGVAVMELKETLSHAYGIGVKQVGENLVKSDIDMQGAEDWFDYAVKDKPKEPGVYTFEGTVAFDDDSADYNLRLIPS